MSYDTGCRIKPGGPIVLCSPIILGHLIDISGPIDQICQGGPISQGGPLDLNLQCGGFDVFSTGRGPALLY